MPVNIARGTVTPLQYCVSPQPVLQQYTDKGLLRMSSLNEVWFWQLRCRPLVGTADAPPTTAVVNDKLQCTC